MLRHSAVSLVSRTINIREMEQSSRQIRKQLMLLKAKSLTNLKRVESDVGGVYLVAQSAATFDAGHSVKQNRPPPSSALGRYAAYALVLFSVHRFARLSTGTVDTTAFTSAYARGSCTAIVSPGSSLLWTAVLRPAGRLRRRLS